MVPVQAKYKIWCISINNDGLYIISIPMSNDTITMKRQFYGFSWMKMYEFRLKFHWSLFLGSLMNNIPALAQIMAWRRPGDKPLSEPMMLRILTHICVTWPHWVKKQSFINQGSLSQNSWRNLILYIQIHFPCVFYFVDIVSTSSNAHLG